MASPDDETAQPPSKRPRREPQADEGAAEPTPRVELNPADCDLDFDVGDGGLRGSARHDGGFAYCWSGARAAVGVRGRGKYCFGCRIIAEQPVEMDDTDADRGHLCRVGVSRGDDPVGALGESDHSFGFGGTGKFSHQRRFTDYGVKFGVGDTVVCTVDLDSKPMASIGFARNGEWLGVAKHFDAGENGLGLIDAPVRPMQWESALFPHVLLKNVVVEMQFSREDGLEPIDGYEPWALAYAGGNAVSGPVFDEHSECEVMMMVGLPASGKTTWAEKWIRNHPEKRFILLGTNLALDQMKVPGLVHKNNYGERFDRLMDRATGIFNTLLARAANIPRNCIIDQTNVYRSARIRKLRPFSNYRKTAVVVFPLSSELKSRAAKRFSEMGKEVPAEAVNDMIGIQQILSYHSQTTCLVQRSLLMEVIFIELSRYDAQRNLDEMKRMLPRTSTPSDGNFNSRNASSICDGTASSVDPRATSSIPDPHSPMGNSYTNHAIPGSAAPYGRGAHTPVNMMHQKASWSAQSFQSPTGCQCEIYPGYPSASNEYQMPSSYPSNTNQYQVHTSYQSTPPPVYGQSSYGSYGSPSLYNPNPYSPERHHSIQAPMSARNLFRTLGAEAYGGFRYAATNLNGRPLQVHPSSLPTYDSHPGHQLGAYQGSSDNYMPYGQQYHGVHNSGPQYAAPALAPRPSHHGVTPSIINPLPTPWHS